MLYFENLSPGKFVEHKNPPLIKITVFVSVRANQPSNKSRFSLILLSDLRLKMDNLSDLQIKALRDIFTIGIGRAASSLNEIITEEVKLSVLSVELCKCAELKEKILSLDQPQLSLIKQQIHGAFRGEASLLFTQDSTLAIMHDIMGSQISTEKLAEFEQEAMCELGNIVLNACLSSLADMLKIELGSLLPTYYVCNSDEIMNHVIATEGQLHIMVLYIELKIERRQVNGQLIFLFSSPSLDELCVQINTFLEKI
jgi:chemotaxis protein CheC